MIMLRSSTRSEILLRRRGMKDVQIMVAQEYQTWKTDVKRDLTKIPRILAPGPLKKTARAGKQNHYINSK